MNKTFFLITAFCLSSSMHSMASQAPASANIPLSPRSTAIVAEHLKNIFVRREVLPDNADLTLVEFCSSKDNDQPIQGVSKQGFSFKAEGRWCDNNKMELIGDYVFVLQLCRRLSGFIPKSKLDELGVNVPAPQPKPAQS